MKATVSLRVVPDQDTDTVARTLVEHLQLNFRALQTPNHLEVRRLALHLPGTQMVERLGTGDD